ncbi:MAG: glycine cleavage system protein H [Thermoprotei archaeon]|nr:MAG: glycine cleavage system protein H [Thermoprotei archaeon]
MVKVQDFEIPEDLHYDVKNHIWVKVLEDGNVKIGLDDVGQTLAKKILFVRIRKVGTKVLKGKALAMLESAKWTGPMLSPVSGEIVAVNEELKKKPRLINEDPYGKGWVAIVKPSNLEEDLRTLVTGDEALKAQEKDIIERGVKKE